MDSILASNPAAQALILGIPKKFFSWCCWDLLTALHCLVSGQWRSLIVDRTQLECYKIAFHFLVYCKKTQKIFIYPTVVLVVFKNFLCLHKQGKKEINIWVNQCHCIFAKSVSKLHSSYSKEKKPLREAATKRPNSTFFRRVNLWMQFHFARVSLCMWQPSLDLI